MKKRKITTFDIVVYTIAIILTVLVMYPLILVVSCSFSDPGLVSTGKVVLLPKGFNVDDYANKIFKMYDGDDVIVELECQNELMKYIIDRYGTEVDTEVCTKDTFIARVPATLSPTFFGWVFQFAGKMKIINPKEAVEEFRDTLKKQL